MPQAPLKGPGKYPREYLPPLPGHSYLTRVGSSQLPLKGTAPPFGSKDRLRASPRMYPREMRGPPRGLSFTAAPQGRWASDAASALPPPLLHFPFGSLQDWVGAGRASPSGLGSPSLSSPSACLGAGAAPGNPWLAMGPTPACELSSGPRLLGLGQPPRVCEQVLHGAGMSSGVQVGPPPALEPWSPAEVAARLALVPGLTDVREGKGPRS